MSIVKKYKSIVASIENKFSGIYTLELSSPDKPFRFSPGQFLHLALEKDYDGIGQWPESRCFSMQSNPDECNIRITYAVKGKFTHMMEDHLRVGSGVWLKLPYGDLFTRPHNKANSVFIAGGTGITPFLSLFTHKSFSGYTNPRIYLGFRSSAFNIYEGELELIKLNKNFMKNQDLNIVYEDIRGKLNIQDILRENGTDPDYFISGPPEMIKSFKNYLLADGVPILHVKTDDWE